MTMPPEIQLSKGAPPVSIYPQEFHVTAFEYTEGGGCVDEYALRDGDQDKIVWHPTTVLEDSEGDRFLIVLLRNLRDVQRFCEYNEVERIDFTKTPVIRLRCINRR